MSFPELLDAARALPRDEQLKLANTLLEPEPAVAPDVPEYLRAFPEHLWPFIPASGATIEYWSPVTETDAAGWAVIEKMVQEIEATRSARKGS